MSDLSASAPGTGQVIQHQLCDRLRLGLISETLDLVASYASSAAEAAWREDRATLEVQLKQTRLSLLTAIEAFKQLGGGK